MCNTDNRITNRRTQNRAAQLVKDIVAVKGQRGAARMLHVNPGTVHHILDNTPQAWTHVTLDAMLMAKIELAAVYVTDDDNLSDEIKAQIDHVMALESELAHALRELKRKIKRL